VSPDRLVVAVNLLTDMWRFHPFDAHCCHMGTAIKHPVPDRVKPSFVMALWHSRLSVRVPLQMTA